MAGIGLLGGLMIAGWAPRPGSSAVQAAPAVAQTAAYSENQPAVSDGAPQFRLVADRDGDDYQNDWRGRDSDYRSYNRYGNNYGYSNGYYGSSYPYNDGYHHSHRSTGESVAIVGGSAAAGAAIGGLAKGGKGAAIGAIGGGVGGLIYDRATAHNHH
jgi:hypothetical protein